MFNVPLLLSWYNGKSIHSFSTTFIDFNVVNFIVCNELIIRTHKYINVKAGMNGIFARFTRSIGDKVRFAARNTSVTIPPKSARVGVRRYGPRSTECIYLSIHLSGRWSTLCAGMVLLRRRQCF